MAYELITKVLTFNIYRNLTVLNNRLLYRGKNALIEINPQKTWQI